MTNTPDMTKTAIAHGKYIRGSASKVRRVLDQIRGKSYRDALIILEFMPYRSTDPITKVLRSAVAEDITREEGSIPKLCSAFATADLKTLVIGSVDLYGINSNIISASL